MPHLLRTTMTIERPIETVFAFFADATNLERITPPELRFSILTAPPPPVEEGALIDYRLQLFGLPFRWRSEITHWRPPFEFVDTQLHGPYRQWVHTHRFRRQDQATVIDDEVLYLLPLWPLGELAAPLVKFQLHRIFAYRQRTIRALLQGEPTGGDT